MAISLEEDGAYLDDTGVMRMDVKIYTYDLFDMVENRMKVETISRMKVEMISRMKVEMISRMMVETISRMMVKAIIRTMVVMNLFQMEKSKRIFQKQK